jgi:hypothetical protein
MSRLITNAPFRPGRNIGNRGRYRPKDSFSFDGKPAGIRGVIIVYLGNSGEFYIDKGGNVYGPDVKLVLTTFDGDRVVKMLPAALATALLLHNDLENGADFRSGHIEYGGIIDVWGGSV